MILMQLNNIKKYFGADLILSNIKLEVHSQDRIAIVGRNGAGKSTLLKIMSGEYTYDKGEMIRPRDTSIGYLAQNTGLESSLTIWEEMEQVFSELKHREKELRKLEEQMADPDLLEDRSTYEEILESYDTKQEEFRRLGGFEYEADIKAVLNGLQFSNVDTSISELSGGQKTRLALGKLLLSKPDILILDEPTNHLDIGTLNWLEQYLQNYQGAVVIVSHDRYFLDKTVNVVYEISFQTSNRYTGNYSDYLVQKAKDYEQNVKQYEKQQAEVKKLEDFIQKNIVRASTTKRAQSRRKKLEKMELMDKPMLENQSAKFSFDIERQSGNDVLKLEDLSFRYHPDKPDIFQHVNLSIHREDRIGLVGPNGIGKSTLLKTIIGQLNPHQGNIAYGTNVQMGYYDQEQTNLSSNKTVLDELWDEYPLKPEKEIRTVLGNFLFSGDDVLKTIPSLSGGEKARLVLAKLMLQKANFLIMDEPTNHLDLDSKEVLEAALMDFPGTILFVSHDRYFINRIATKIVEMSEEGTTLYLGDYDYYLMKKQEEKEMEELNAVQDEPTHSQEDKNQFLQDKAQKRETRKLERRVEELEGQIHELEGKIEENEQHMVQPDSLNDHEKLQDLTNENEQMSAKLDELLEEWTSLQEKLADN